jgi:hypothetical protein
MGGNGNNEMRCRLRVPTRCGEGRALQWSRPMWALSFDGERRRIEGLVNRLRSWSLRLEIHGSASPIGQTSCLYAMSGDLGNVYALSGELRNELYLKWKEPLLIFATVNERIASGDLRNRTFAKSYGG